MKHNTLAVPTEKTYYLDGEFWRSALYMVIGAVLVCGLLPWALSIKERLNAFSLSVGFLFLSPCIIIGFSLLLPRSRPDSEGIHRRIFYGLWDTWDWESFQPGSIREGYYLDSYLYKGKPFWASKLNLIYYPEEVRKIVRGVFRRNVSRTSVFTPDAIEFTANSQNWRFDDSGITRTDQHSVKLYRWIDVRKVTGEKLTHDHLNFRKLCLFLPDDELNLSTKIEDGQLWKGAKPEQILSFLNRHVSEVHLEITAIHGKPRTVPEAEERLANIAHHLKEMKKVRITLSILLPSVVVPTLFWNLKYFIIALIIGPAYYFMWIVALREQTERLEKDRSEIQE